MARFPKKSLERDDEMSIASESSSEEEVKSEGDPSTEQDDDNDDGDDSDSDDNVVDNDDDEEDEKFDGEEEEDEEGDDEEEEDVEGDEDEEEEDMVEDEEDGEDKDEEEVEEEDEEEVEVEDSVSDFSEGKESDDDEDEELEEDEEEEKELEEEEQDENKNQYRDDDDDEDEEDEDEGDDGKDEDYFQGTESSDEVDLPMDPVLEKIKAKYRTGYTYEGTSSDDEKGNQWIEERTSKLTDSDIGQYSNDNKDFLMIQKEMAAIRNRYDPDDYNGITEAMMKWSENEHVRNEFSNFRGIYEFIMHLHITYKVKLVENNTVRENRLLMDMMENVFGKYTKNHFPNM